jgi:hypothetical protein
VDRGAGEAEAEVCRRAGVNVGRQRELIRVRDRVAGGFLTASQVEAYLNAAELETEGGE